TGRVHWRPLLQARAIESLAYVIAAGQWGEHAGGRKTYGHSMIVGPWGDVLGCREEGAGVVFADLDMIGQERLRNQFPVLTHRRELCAMIQVRELTAPLATAPAAEPLTIVQ